jgi:hypothetical protein
MRNAITSETPVSTGLRQQRARMIWDGLDGCVCCGGRDQIVRAARFGYIPFCQSCLDRSLHPGMWDDLGEAGD